MNIDIQYIPAEAASTDKKWLITCFEEGKPWLYHAPISKNVYEAIKYLQSENKELLEKKNVNGNKSA